ncbi:hypothetical protein GQ42DRAFT_64300 [Ramicandelaber brevisporus]|nr:hypothetical protein GQ42DRAFT_64300 [Ramicandelaber brevisporus]
MIWMLQPASARRVDDTGTGTVEVKCSNNCTLRFTPARSSVVSRSAVAHLVFHTVRTLSSPSPLENIVNCCCCSCRSHCRSPLSLSSVRLDHRRPQRIKKELKARKKY